MREIRKLKTELTEYDIEVIKDIYTNAECYNNIEFYKMILEQFNSDELVEEAINEGICPMCYSKELEMGVGFEDEFQKMYVYECKSCGNIID